MIRHRSKVTSSQYQARYSPFTTLSRTTTFFACQKASLVSKSQWSKTAFRMYWKEYFPFMRTFLNWRSSARIMKYSLSAVQSSIRTCREDQPNSGEMTSQPRRTASRHSRRALMPWSLVSVISMWSEYHRAARHRAVSSEPVSFSPWSCQKG